MNEQVRCLLEKIIEYEELFPEKDNAMGSFDEIVSALELGEGHMGRGDIYPRILSELYACPERASILEETLLIELYGEIPRLKKARELLSDVYGTGPDTEDIDIEMASQRRVRVQDAMVTMDRLRDRMMYWGVRRLIDYPHEVDAAILETPLFLRPFVPVGKVINMNGLPAKPRTDLFITVDPASYRPISFPDMVVTLAREELGSRAHFLNSFLKPHEIVPGTDLLPSTIISSTMNGFALTRELEVVGMLRDMSVRKDELLPDERYLVEHIENFCTLEELISDLDFLISKERVLALLKGIADLRVNSGKQSIPDLMRWAHIISGIREPVLLESIMEAVSEPGYHAVSMMISMGVRESSQAMVNQGVSLLEFNTHATRFGFPSWRFLRQRSMDL